MSDTPNIDLPVMAQNTLQPSVSFNEAMQLLDALLVLVVQDKDLTAPPSTLEADTGKRWIVGASATGAWAGQSTSIAICTGANLWSFIVPKAEFRARVLDEGKYYRFTGTAWTDDTAAGAVPEAPSDGVLYARENGGWVAVPSGISDASSDSKIYGRENGGWVQVPGGTVKTVNGSSPDAAGNVAISIPVVGQLAGLNDQTGTTYTLALSDAGKSVRCTNAASVAVTIPPSSAVAFPVGTWLLLNQGGAGVVTATAGAGVTLHAPNGAATTAQYDARALLKTDTDTWSVL